MTLITAKSWKTSRGKDVAAVRLKSAEIVDCHGLWREVRACMCLSYERIAIYFEGLFSLQLFHSAQFGANLVPKMMEVRDDLHCVAWLFWFHHVRLR